MFKKLGEINPNGSTLVGWIDFFTKTGLKPLLVYSNPNPNKPWILAQNKVLIKSKQALIVADKIKIKLISLSSVLLLRKEEEKKIL
jgi:hypothetical protein